MKTTNSKTNKTFLDSLDLKKNTESPEQAGAQTIEFIGTASFVDEMNKRVRHRVMEIPDRCSTVSETVEKIERGLDGTDLEEFLEFGGEFYSDYDVSPGTVIECLGYDLTLRTFRALAPLWQMIAEPNEIEYFDSLEDTLVLYRTGSGSLGSVAKGLCWTRKNTAEWGHAQTPSSILIQAELPKTGVLAITSDLEFIIDPEKISRAELIE